MTSNVWEAVIGQAAAVQQLKHAAADPQALTHAWLIVGPPGSGRSTAARAFAATLECDTRTGCGHCENCRMVSSGTHPDVKIIATDKVIITREQVKDLVAEAVSRPSVGRYRIFIIEDADRMVQATGNVLLKAIEEPAATTIWLLCAPTAQDVIPTIRSRCRTVRLQVPKADDVAALLMREGVDPQTAASAARTAQSHIGMARWLATDPEALNRRQAVFDMLAAMRSVPAATIQATALVDAAKAEAAAATTALDASEQQGLRIALGLTPTEAIPMKLRTQFKELEEDQKRRGKRQERDVLHRTCTDILSLLRDVLVVQFAADATAVNAASPSAATLAGQLATRLTPADVLARVEAVQTAQTRLAANVPPQLAMEAMLLALQW